MRAQLLIVAKWRPLAVNTYQDKLHEIIRIASEYDSMIDDIQKHQRQITGGLSIQTSWDYTSLEQIEAIAEGNSVGTLRFKFDRLLDELTGGEMMDLLAMSMYGRVDNGWTYERTLEHARSLNEMWDRASLLRVLRGSHLHMSIPDALHRRGMMLKSD